MLRSMLGSWYGRKAVLWACLCTAAVSPAAGCLAPPTPQEVLATGFRTPDQTFATFKTALRGDLLALEYRSFSVSFRALHGIPSLMAYSKAREELLKREPLLRWIATAEIIDRVELSPNRMQLTAEV